MNLLILGADSLTGRALTQLVQKEGLNHHALSTGEFLGLNKSDLTKTLTRLTPSMVIYVARFSGLAQAEVDSEAARQCDQVNSLGVSSVAELCAKLQVPLMFHSSSLVFDGTKAHPYEETDQANPRSRYGISKLAGERAIRELLPAHVILRTDWVFSAERTRYFRRLLSAFRENKGKVSVMSQRFCPTPASDVARVLLAIAKQADCTGDVWGTYHYCALLPMSQEFFAEHVIQEAAKYDPEIAALLPKLEIEKLPANLPWIGNSVLSSQLLFETFGIKQRSRAAELNTILQKLANFVPAPVVPDPVPAPEVVEEAGSPATAEPKTGGQKRRVRKKSGSARPAKKAEKQTK